MDFLKITSLEEAIQAITEKPSLFSTTLLPIQQALGKILAQPIISKENIPHFRRSSVDGYAVHSANLSGAGENNPVFLTLAGQVKIGFSDTGLKLPPGHCIEVPTGGIIPPGADGVAMVEYTEDFGPQIAISTPVSPYENIVEIGDDVKIGEEIFKKGRRLAPKDIGTLAALGVTFVKVFHFPSLSIISTGDELVLPSTQALPLGKIRDISTYSLQALGEKHGFATQYTRLLVDDLAILKEAITTQVANQKNGIVVISGGSSYGKYDMTAQAINETTSPGVFIHGLALKPGKPTILAYHQANNTLVIGLPGHPVSALIVFELLLAGLVEKSTHTPPPLPIAAQLGANVPAADGKHTVYPCQLDFHENAYIATPIFGKSATITSLTKSDGYFSIPPGVEGLIKGEIVLVNLL